MKKLVIIPALFILATIINIACENCEPYKDTYILTSSGNLDIKTTNGYLLNNALYYSDTLNVYTNFKNECVASSNKMNFSLFDAAYAKCKSCGFNGNKNKFLDIKVTASSIINGVPVDSSINNFVKVKWQNNYGIYNISSLSTYKDTLLNPMNDGRFGCEMVIYPKPNLPFNGKIKVTLAQQNAPPAIAETVNFTWQ